MKRLNEIPNFRDPYEERVESVDSITGLEKITIKYGARDENNQQTSPNGTEGLLEVIKDRSYYVTYWKFANYEGGKVDVDQREAFNKAMKARVSIVEKAKALKDSDDYSKASFEFRNLMNEWKETERFHMNYEQKLWEEFNGYRNEFYNALKASHEQNAQTKKEFIEKAKRVDKSNLSDATKEILQLQKDWKTIRSAGKDVDDTLWDEFKQACDDFFAYKKENYETHTVPLQKEAYNKKKELIEKAKEITDINSGVESFKELMNLWKQAGFAGDENDALWEEFNGYQQEFFNKRRAHFDEIHKEYEENYKKKKALLEEAEHINSEAEYDRDYNFERTNRMKQITEDYKKIGHTGRERDNRLWQSLRNTMDDYFDNYGKYKAFRNMN